ncbi:hypothetical protein [Niabella soli]|uniref:Anti-sigma factor n=1 Tax=Niabella soli DSM 19437 TaxID=929713 RepID=W0F9C4_9BACT|nr:hypothetical protein [Niabella soli]AHF18074.1 hypothetical protein NIASO_19855 [Niabella soli DSM 19437]
MSNKLEDFIRKNKQAFDDHEPSGALWKRLEKKMQGMETPDPAPVVKINWWKWAAAAMIIITAGVLSRPYWQHRSDPAMPVALQAPNEKDTNTQEPGRDTLEATQPSLAHGENHPKQRGEQEPKQNNVTVENVQPDGTAKEELYHYARLIEIKQKEIATLKNNHPELFEQFSQDLTTLNSSYSSLKKQYDEGLNSEQLLSAMIENLKLQTEVLNKQLEITKKIKKQKNEAQFKNI